SEDGTKLYISKYRFGGSSGGRLYQYDLTTPLINPALIYSVSSSNNIVAKGLKRGPDQKIYMLSANSSGITRYLHVINNPNLAGSSCNFVANQVDMGIDMGITHLFPNFLTANSSVIASCFGLVGIEESSEKLKINLFPNPTTGKFQIEVSNSDLSAIDFIIYNSVGQQIQVGYNELNSNTVEFDLSSKDAGIYILKVREGDKSMTLRLVKE
ncbi:MAG: T9SS type A sorting domain-containing protein, partial [Bacteroidota bacterium]